MSSAQEFPAPGKLNLMLRITGRRADGYHLLQTVIRFIDYGDALKFQVSDDGTIARVNEVAGVPAEAPAPSKPRSLGGKFKPARRRRR